ncbi:MAG: hypothetical protein ACOH2M_01335 [Cypionkella sp.]
MPDIARVVAPIAENALARNARMKREAAERSRAYRQRQKAERAPEVRQVDAAVVEGLAFVLQKYGPLIAAKNTGRSLEAATVPVLELLRAATDVLVHDGYNRQKSREAVADRVASRPEHRDPSHTPSIRPTDDPARVRPPRLWPGDPIPKVLPYRRVGTRAVDLTAMLLDDDDGNA